MSAADPIAQFRGWFRRAERAGVALPEAMALATATPAGRPSVRWVLLKGADARGFVFFGSAISRKGRELEANPRAALAFYWDPIGRQVRIEGRIEPVSPAEADAYWETRPRASQVAASVSRQSAPLASWDGLIERWKAVRRRHRGRTIPRPPTWTGFRVVPEAIEFWTRRQHRLHVRELFVRTARGWRRRLLNP